MKIKDFLKDFFWPELVDGEKMTLESLGVFGGISIIGYFFNPLIIRLANLVLVKYGAGSFSPEASLSVNWSSLLFTILVAPITEELVFRGFLTKNRSFLTLSLVSIFFYTNIVYYNLASLNFLFISITFALLSYLLLVVKLSRMLKLIEKYYPYLYYVQAVIFGFLHLGNYPYQKIPIIYWPLLAFYYVYVGFLLGYVRNQAGVKYSILFHLSNNLGAVLKNLKPYISK